MMKIRFLGATGTVTGSKYLVEFNQKKILVDCGLFQGLKELRLRNWAKLPISPKEIDAVLITHAHIDHTGYLPLLVREGFVGPIYATEATYDLCKLLLPDSGYLQEEDARRANKYGYTKHHPAMPLYTQADGEDALRQFKPISFATPQVIEHGFKATWFPASHILGASFIRCEFEGKKLLFSGDIGRFDDPIMRPPTIIKNTDYLVMESTYGDRLHEEEDTGKKLARIINNTAETGGTIVIPSFAVGRAQTLLYYIYELKKAKKIPNLPVFLDSPMAESATDIFSKHVAEHKLTPEECQHVCSSATYVRTSDESKQIDAEVVPKIIISASGMATGGRVLHHLKRFAPDFNSTILFAGYQAAGTRGEAMMAGKREIKIHGEMIKVKARVEMLSNLSAHADYEGILTWLRGFESAPRQVFITHGKPEAAASLKAKIEKQLGWNCLVPQYLQEIDL